MQSFQIDNRLLYCEGLLKGELGAHGERDKKSLSSKETIILSIIHN
jgi:hypothetical protein